MARRTPAPRSGRTILVVDDQEELLVSVRSLLEREGHRVLTATSGAEALALFRREEVHLLLIDYFMPGMNGADLIREIRTFDPYVQIILQTGYAGEKPARAMMAALDIQGYHDKTDGPEKLLLWIDAGLKAYELIHRLRERERLHGELVANVSHEFRTPLNVIGGYTELLLDGHFGALPPDAERPLRAIAQATGNLAELVSDFLSYARANAGTLRVGRHAFATAELVRELRRFGALLTEGRDLAYRVDAAAAPATLYTDGAKLRTILRNLVTNAVKFTERGRVTVRIARDGENVRFEVSDTGPGIPADSLEVIFEPFRQLDGSATRLHGGIGLGLALSRKLAHILGGRIDVASAPGQGSTFALVLPLETASSEAVPPGPRSRPAPPPA